MHPSLRVAASTAWIRSIVMSLANLSVSIPTYTTLGILAFLLAYVLRYPEKAERVAGWFYRLGALVLGRLDKRAVATSVQAAINDACIELARDVPEGIINGKLRITWANADEARALVRDGQVVVFLRRAEFLEDNIAAALMAFLPQAVTPEARPYVQPPTMQGVDLTLARNILAHNDMPAGARETFRERYLTPVKETPHLEVAFQHADRIDLQGWLTRLMLVEYKFLAEDLLPSDPEPRCLEDCRRFRIWLHEVANRAPGEKGSLEFSSRYIHTAIVFVAVRRRIRDEGLRPYRRRIKRLMYQEKTNSVYIMARDESIPAVAELGNDLGTDALITEVFRCTYPLRRDFRFRIGLDRERGIVLCLRRRKLEPTGPIAAEEEDSPEDLPHERLEDAESEAPKTHDLMPVER